MSHKDLPQPLLPPPLTSAAPSVCGPLGWRREDRKMRRLPFSLRTTRASGEMISSTTALNWRSLAGMVDSLASKSRHRLIFLACAAFCASRYLGEEGKVLARRKNEGSLSLTWRGRR